MTAAAREQDKPRIGQRVRAFDSKTGTNLGFGTYLREIPIETNYTIPDVVLDSGECFRGFNSYLKRAHEKGDRRQKWRCAKCDANGFVIVRKIAGAEMIEILLKNDHRRSSPNCDEPALSKV